VTLRWGVGLSGGALAWIAFLLVVLLTTAAGTPPASSATLSGAVPAQYRQLIERSAASCPQIPVGVFAAQLQVESDFDPGVVSRVGALGIAQFMPGTWVYFGRDIDGNGRASPFDPADAIDAQVRFMCELHGQALGSSVPGEPLALALAGYNAGWGAVTRYRGIPPYAETQAYVKRILRGWPQFATSVGQALSGVPADVLPGGLVLPRGNPRSAARAIEWARKQQAGPAAWYNRCLAFVANAYGWHHSGTHYAIDHYRDVMPTYLRHADRNPPPGALMFWDTGLRAGHVALYLGNGLIASNDIDAPGRISVVPANAPDTKWGARYVGWSAPYFPNAG
jgi:hypothetical protein